jgi:hypothetical protein
MAGLLRRSLPLLAAALVWALVAAPAGACPFCSGQGQTLTDEITQASMVVYGQLANANEGAETTDLKVESVVKGHPYLEGKKVVQLKRYVPPAENDQYRYLVFCDFFKGNLDPYRGIAVKKDSDMPAYLKGALELKDAKMDQKLKFFFKYLDSEDAEISNDAYKFFANTDYRDYRETFKSLPREKVIKWLTAKDTPSFRYGLYASMLGHCGMPEDAKVLRDMLEDPEKKATSGVDGILAGYVMLKPKEGWEYVRGTLKDPGKEFLMRYAALRTVRFLWEYRPDLVSKKQLSDGVSLLLDQEDIADLAVEDLRKWGVWDMTDQVLGLQKKPAYKTPIVRRSVLRFALSCPSNKAAAAYVEEQRKLDPTAVRDAEELLKLEQSATPPAPPAGTGK